MLPRRPNRYREGEISTDGPQSSQKYSESSPLFREYGPQEVKQSPMFADKGISKYGTALKSKEDDVIQANPRKRVSLSKTSFAFQHHVRTVEHRLMELWQGHPNFVYQDKATLVL